MIEYIKYLFLGLIQGITEILPVSSSGQLIVLGEILNLKEPGMTFEIFINAASLIAMILILYRDIGQLIKSFFLYIFKKEEKEIYKKDFLYVLKLIVAIIPVGIIGLIFKNYINDIKNLLTVGIGLLITSTFLLLTYLTRNRYESHEDVSWRDSLFIGFAQTVAVVPGISRSGSTYAGGRASKLSLQSIIKFSMLTYILISIPTSFLGIYEAVNLAETINWLGYSLAFVVTLIATYITGKLVLKRLKLKHLIYFSVYCLIIGGVAITLYFI